MHAMLKTEAIRALGGTPSLAAQKIGITPQAVSLWPDELTPAIRDRVQAALYREKLRKHSAARSFAATKKAAANA